MLGISPWYALLACFSVPLAGMVIYAQPGMSFSNTIDGGWNCCPSGALYLFKSSRDLVEAAVRLGGKKTHCRRHFLPTHAGLSAVASLTGVGIREMASLANI